MTKVAFISDIHYGRMSRTCELTVPGEPVKDETSGAPSLVKGLVQCLKEHSPEYLFVGGDLTSIGSPQEFYYCEKKILEIAEQIGIPSKNIICGLGNHDIDRKIINIANDESYKGLSKEDCQLLQERYQMISAFGALNNLKNLLPLQNSGPAPYSGVLENSNFVVFVLNTSWYCNGKQIYPHGRLSEEQLRWFNNESAKYTNNEKIKIVLMHHHPMKYSYPTLSADASMIEEGSEFLDIAGRNGINLVLHGHRHHPIAITHMQTGWKNPIAFVCAGSLSANAEHRYNGEIPNTMHILQVEKAEDPIILYNFQYTGATGWTPLNSTSNWALLDEKMRLGKVYEEKDMEQAILSIASQEQLIKWEQLDECLKYIPLQVLNDKFTQKLSSQYLIVGKFPDEVALFKLGDEGDGKICR